MSGPFGSSQWMYSAGGSFYPVTIDDSLRWPASGCQLYRGVGTPTDAKKHTHAFWVKVNPDTTQTLNSVYANASGYYSQSGINSDGRIIFGADYARYYYSTMRLRDPSAWVHILQVLDSTEASNSDRMKLYVNGVRQTSFTNFATVPLNWTGSYHATNGFGLRIGRTYTGAAFQSSLLSYTSEYIFVDGQALDPTDFGQFIDGVWVPDTYAGTYGNNGYKLDFSNPANFGEDSSGNGNDFSVTSLAAHDAMPDTPTNNFATLNPLDNSGQTLSEGNLKFYNNASSHKGARGNFGMASGKWYFECSMSSISGGDQQQFGLARQNVACPTNGSAGNTFMMYWSGGNPNNNYIYNDGANNGKTAQSVAVGDVLKCAYDADTGKLWLGKNSDWYNISGAVDGSANPANGTNPTMTLSETEPLVTWVHSYSNAGTYNICNFGQDGTFAGNITAGGNADANGVGDFKYSVPSGYLALCTANLPDPTIGPTADTLATDNFNTVLYTGNGSSQSITGVGFSPDALWLKERSSTSQNQLFHDTDGGVPKFLQPSTTIAEVQNAAVVSSFDADGFSVGNSGGSNQSGQTYVGWNWYTGASPTSNTDGSLTSQVSTNVDAGFSIVTWSGNATAGATVGHGLGVAPDVIIFKRRDGVTDWHVYHSSIPNGNTYLAYLNTTAAAASTNAFLNSTYPSSSVITLGDSLGTNGSSMIAYCFADVDGYSKMGKYVGNGSTNGPFVYIGFRPAFVITKESTSTSGWNLRDNVRSPENVVNEVLQANTSSAEMTSGYDVDFLSNGFKVRTSLSDSNASGQTYIYLAFAENPFKYANAR